MKIKFKKLHKDAVLPVYGTEHSAGMDLVAITDPVIEVKYKQDLILINLILINCNVF